jgi:hypothetical protein
MACSDEEHVQKELVYLERSPSGLLTGCGGLEGENKEESK